MKISYSFVTSFYKCKELSLQRPEDIKKLKVHSEIEGTLELKAKIYEKRHGTFTILQLIKVEKPDVWRNRTPDNEEEY